VGCDGPHFDAARVSEKRAGGFDGCASETVSDGAGVLNMKKELFHELLQSVKEAVAIERGGMKPSRKFEVKGANDVVRVRTRLGLSQTKFARLLGISEDTLQNWEQGRRKPTGSAKVLLKIAAKHPDIILEAAA
jgi:putative transcriptional regulator